MSDSEDDGGSSGGGGSKAPQIEKCTECCCRNFKAFVIAMAHGYVRKVSSYSASYQGYLKFQTQMQVAFFLLILSFIGFFLFGIAFAVHYDR